MSQAEPEKVCLSAQMVVQVHLGLSLPESVAQGREP